MPLDTEIEMSPASGLAQVELVPIRKDFLRGQGVFLDYSTMEDATEAGFQNPSSALLRSQRSPSIPKMRRF